MAATQEVHSYHQVRLRNLWISLATGAVVWSLHLLISYPITSLACARGWMLASWGPFTVARWVIIGLTVVATAAVLYAAIYAYRSWRQLERTNGTMDQEPGGRFYFLAYSGVLLNAIFLLSIVTSLIPTLILPLCD